MRKAEATRLIANLDPSTPFYVRVEWMQLLAALVAVFRDEAERTAPGPNRKIWQLLHTATAADRTEWYSNNIRLRHSFPRQRLSLLPVGTTSNESLHHEVNCWFRETHEAANPASWQACDAQRRDVPPNKSAGQPSCGVGSRERPAAVESGAMVRLVPRACSGRSDS